MSLILDGTNGLSDVDGSAATPAIRGSDANTGIFFPAADTIAFAEGGVEVAKFDSSANFSVQGAISSTIASKTAEFNAAGGSIYSSFNDGTKTWRVGVGIQTAGMFTFRNHTDGTVPVNIDSSGDLLVGKTSGGSLATNGIGLRATNDVTITTDGATSLYINRNTDDGTLVQFRQANTEEGSISVSGSTVSYNGGHLSRWAQTTTAKDDTLVKGTVLSNLDEMNVYTDVDGNPVENEQLNKVKVSDVEGDANVAGVFVNWTHDDAHDVDEINMAMTGDMIIRIAEGVIVARGDLLMSAGDGTAKPQGDDIVRSKTIAKVTSTHVTCTYADGSFCVPCVLMAC
jgi:hypothetical protein